MAQLYCHAVRTCAACISTGSAAEDLPRSSDSGPPVLVPESSVPPALADAKHETLDVGRCNKHGKM